jgi:transposase
MATSPGLGMEQQPTPRATWFMAFELSLNTWQLGFTTGSAQRPRERSVPARELAAVQPEITRAKPRCGLPEDGQGLSCYEAGRDGFWLHRWFVAQGVKHCVVDSSRSAVNRRRRRAKTDRLDVHQLLTMLLRHVAGERRVWSVVRVPSGEEEDRRQLHRALTTAKQERTRVINRIKGLLAVHGLGRPASGDFPPQLAALRLWAGAPLPAGRRHRLGQEWEPVQA